MSARAMRNQARRSGGDGFSLIELLVVIGVILIMSAIAVPNLIKYTRNYQIRAAASELANEIQRARATAVMKNVRYGVVLVLQSPNTYQFVIEDLQEDAAKVGAAQLYVELDTANRRQLGPQRRLPGAVVFGEHCPGFAATTPGLRFTSLGTMCQPAGGSMPRVPGECPVLPASYVNHVAFDAVGRATVCLEDTVRGLARQVIVSPGGRAQIVDTVFES